MIARARTLSVAALPVAERVDGRALTVAGGGREAAYAELGGFVVAFTARGVARMPNGIAVDRVPAAGERVTVAITDTWDPTLRLGDDPGRRGAEILAVLGREPPRALAEAVERRDPELAARAAEQLLGLGGGLTPEGDDLVAATAAIVAAGSWPGGEKDAWLRAVLPADLRRRTTALSATLLELATRAQVVEPMHGLFGADWRPALERLVRIGHSTGRAYATAATLAAQAASTGRS
jgi:uncharacterized protein DUF2877